MRISDWSSDVCSSDLSDADSPLARTASTDTAAGDGRAAQPWAGSFANLANGPAARPHIRRQPGRTRCRSGSRSAGSRATASLDRRSVVDGKGGYVRLELGGRGFIKKKKKR